MSGWQLKRGELYKGQVTEEEFWALFNMLFSQNSKKRNTYKFGFIKSILDNLFNAIQENNGYFISYNNLFSKFTENYWNLVLKYHLKQMRRDGKSESSKIETILIKAANRFPPSINLEFSSIKQSEKDLIVQQVQSECIKYVVGALFNDFEGKLYAFDIKGIGITLSETAYNFMLKFKPEIELLNYYSWAKFLEGINTDDVVLRVLDKLELSTPRRQDLSIYRNILFIEYEEHNCFYCGSKLKGNIHVDHFIPWSFIKDDKMWNLVLACRKCNERKSNKLPDHSYIKKLQLRNEKLLEDGVMKDDFSAYTPTTLQDTWKYARISGLKEYDNVY